MIHLLGAVLLLLHIISFQCDLALADSQDEFKEHMQTWDAKRELASQYLLEAETAFKSGDELTGCVTQQKAGEYGIEATNALIKAMKMNNTENGLEDLKAGLRKWRELKEVC